MINNSTQFNQVLIGNTRADQGSNLRVISQAAQSTSLDNPQDLVTLSHQDSVEDTAQSAASAKSRLKGLLAGAAEAEPVQSGPQPDTHSKDFATRLADSILLPDTPVNQDLRDYSERLRMLRRENRL